MLPTTNYIISAYSDYKSYLSLFGTENNNKRDYTLIDLPLFRVVLKVKLNRLDGCYIQYGFYYFLYFIDGTYLTQELWRPAYLFLSFSQNNNNNELEI